MESSLNVNKLKSMIVLQGFPVAVFLERANIDKSKYYRALRGEYEFNREEIVNIVKALGLTEEETSDIFFSAKVS